MLFRNYQYITYLGEKWHTVMVIMHYTSSFYIFILHCFPVSVTYLNAFPKRGLSCYHWGKIHMGAVYDLKKYVRGSCSLDLPIVFIFQKDYGCITIRC